MILVMRLWWNKKAEAVYGCPTLEGARAWCREHGLRDGKMFIHDSRKPAVRRGKKNTRR
jgi:hypothetical protein